MSTQLLIVPYPLTRNKCMQTDNDINNAFGGSSPNVVALSKNVKAAKPDEGSFREYIPMLGALIGAKVKTSYTSPFSSRETFESDEGATEVINTLWNYIGLCQQRILEYDSSNTDQLREIKVVIEDILACTDDLGAVVRETSHPFFNETLVDYMRAYNRYTVAIWQVAIIQASNKSKLFVARQALQAVECIKDAERFGRSLPDSSRTYLSPIAQATLAFYQAFAFFTLGNYNMNSSNIAMGIQCYRAGVRYINKDSRVDFAPTLANAITFMKRAITTTKDQAEEENRKVYNVYVKDGEPELPKVLPLQILKPTSSLLINMFFGEEDDPFAGDPFADMPGSSGKPSGGNPTGGIPTAKPNDDPFAGMPTGKPAPANDDPFAGMPTGKPTPGDDDPWATNKPTTRIDDPWATNKPTTGPTTRIDDPWASSQVPPPANGGSPGYGNPYGAPPASQGPTIDPFPVWDIVNSMKQQCSERLQRLASKPNVANEANMLLRQLQQANQSDQAIQAMINQFKAGTSNLNQKQIEANVQQAMTFYSNVDAKISKLEMA